MRRSNRKRIRRGTPGADRMVSGIYREVVFSSGHEDGPMIQDHRSDLMNMLFGRAHFGPCLIAIAGRWPGDPPDVVHIVTAGGAETFLSGYDLRFVEDA